MNPETCPICLEDLQNGDEIINTTCNHKFHQKCLYRWHNNNFSNGYQQGIGTCPICRSISFDESDFEQ